MTGFTPSTYNHGVPHYNARFYVAGAPAGKVALWAAYTGKWLYWSPPYGRLASLKGEVQQDFQQAPIQPKEGRTTPKLSQYYLQVIPAPDGKVKLKTEYDTYIMAGEHWEEDDNSSMGHYAENSWMYKKYPERALWTVVDLGKFDLPIPQSSFEPCSGLARWTCVKAGPEKPAFKILK